MTSRKPRPFRFHQDVCVDLRALLGNDDVIAELQNAAGDYVVRESRRDVTAPARRRADVRRIKRAIERADPWVRFNLRRFFPELEAVLQGSAQGSPGRRRNDLRHQLEFAIGHTLQRHGIKLTLARGGKLASTIQLVLHAISGKNLLKEPLPTCRRVRDQVRDEARGVADLNRAFR